MTLARLRRRPGSWAAHSHPERDGTTTTRADRFKAWAAATRALIDEAKEPVVTTRPALTTKGDTPGERVGETVP